MWFDNNSNFAKLEINVCDMCEIFVDLPKPQYNLKNKSIRLDGFVTSISLENHFWSILEHIAIQDKLTLGQLCSKLYNEYVELHGAINRANFASFLRVCCLRYLSLKIPHTFETENEKTKSV